MPRLKRIDHIGFVVADIQESIGRYKNLLFQEPFLIDYFEPAKADIAFFDIGGVHVELLAPTDPDSLLGKFLREKGGGYHHICFEVDDLLAVLKVLKDQGSKLIDETPRSGSRNSQIAFVDPVSTDGILIEYCQFPKEKE